MRSPQQKKLRSLVKGAYDLQDLRLRIGGRLVANINSRLGMAPGEKQDEKEEKKLLTKIVKAYHRMTDGVADLLITPDIRSQDEFQGQPLIDGDVEYYLVQQYIKILKEETIMLGQNGMIAKALNQFSLWTEKLKDERGVGPAIAGIIISEIDIEHAEKVSQIWSYAGFGVEKDGRGTSRRKEHLVEREYEDTNGDMQTKLGIKFNPLLKTKMVGVAADVFIRMQNRWSTVYYQYKYKVQQNPDKIELTPAHIDRMAKRYMMKQFFIWIYREWRTLRNLPVRPSWHEQYGGGHPWQEPMEGPTKEYKEMIERHAKEREKQRKELSKKKSKAA